MRKKLLKLVMNNLEHIMAREENPTFMSCYVAYYEHLKRELER